MPSFRLRIVVFASVALLLTCDADGPIYRDIDLGIDVRLNAVRANTAYSSFVAVGADGTVAYYHDAREAVQVWKLGDAELRAVDVIPEAIPIEAGFLSTGSHLWFVVGDGGAIFVGHETNTQEFTWFAQPNVGADLRGVTAIRDENGLLTAVVVGDEFMATGVSTGEVGMFEWSEVPPPPEGWGRLRHVDGTSYVYRELRAIGEQGRMWTTDLGPAGWVPVELDTDADLTAGRYDDSSGSAQAHFCGTDGSFVGCNEGVCSTKQLGPFDLVACNYDWLLGSDRRIYELRPDDPVELELLGWQPRAADGTINELVMVGDGGRAAIWALNEEMHVGCL